MGRVARRRPPRECADLHLTILCAFATTTTHFHGSSEPSFERAVVGRGSSEPSSSVARANRRRAQAAQPAWRAGELASRLTGPPARFCPASDSRELAERTRRRTLPQPVTPALSRARGASCRRRFLGSAGPRKPPRPQQQQVQRNLLQHPWQHPRQAEQPWQPQPQPQPQQQQQAQQQPWRQQQLAQPEQQHSSPQQQPAGQQHRRAAARGAAAVLLLRAAGPLGAGGRAAGALARGEAREDEKEWRRRLEAR